LLLLIIIISIRVPRFGYSYRYKLFIYYMMRMTAETQSADYFVSFLLQIHKFISLLDYPKLKVF